MHFYEDAFGNLNRETDDYQQRREVIEDPHHEEFGELIAPDLRP